MPSSVTMLNPNIPFNIMPLKNHSDKKDTLLITLPMSAHL